MASVRCLDFAGRACVPALAALALALSAHPAGAYADRAGTDIVTDAPWRTVRDYVPVLFFLPQFEGGRSVERIRVFESVAGVPIVPAVVIDQRVGPDTLSGATFVGMQGEAREGLSTEDRGGSFWHYIVRVPHAALAHHGTPDVHDLCAEVEWTRPASQGRQMLRNHRVLRVLFDPAQFPRLDPADRYFDTHVHTIAEQTTSWVMDVNGASKAFGGPVVMLLESAYALGLVQTQPREGNWEAFRDSVVVTDHNIFYSAPPYDTGTAPRGGPTAASNGHAGEAAWYRANLGRLAGEEITLRRGSNQDWSLTPNLGHHLLAYGTSHFEGPWHGGVFLTSHLENPNTLLAVLTGMRAAGRTGFAYASHPGLEGFVWPPEYFDQAIGFPPHNSIAGPQVNSTCDEFLFAGSEVWNIKPDRVAAGSGRLAASRAFDVMNPFEGGPAEQRFVARPWDAELSRSIDVYLGQVQRGLAYSFREAQGTRFVRKLYMSAGSDAHGDFNYSDEVSATAVPYSGMLNSNAFARVRTCALTHQRPADARNAIDAFRDGNTVLTDGPVFEYYLDSDARDDPGRGAGRWHDGIAAFENAAGCIGGHGRFDGGGTVLVPSPGADVWIRSRWMRSATPGAGEIAKLRFDRVTMTTRDSFEVGTGGDGELDERPLPRPMDRLSALVATARDLSSDERCIANPVWVAPVRIEVSTGMEDALQAVAIAPCSLRAVFDFPFSMADAPARVRLRPLDSEGNSTDPEIELVPDPGWQERDGIAGARYSACNADSVALAAGDWDAAKHESFPGVKSFVVYFERPADAHGNVLNDIGRSFAIRSDGVAYASAAADLEPPAPIGGGSASPSGGTYRFPLAKDQFRVWAINAFGPSAVAGGVVSASLSQWVTEEPPEWLIDRKGFGKRFGVAWATTAITETSLSALAAAMRQDNGYYRCPNSGFGRRLTHALKMTFMARGADGNAVYSVPKTVSPFVGPMVTRTTLYPDGYTAADGLLGGVYVVLLNAGWNVAREFVLKAPAW